MKTMNKAEQRGLLKLWTRSHDGFVNYLAFRRSCHYIHHMHCWGINWCGMFVGIEHDGYTHT
jgi:hypothetical protein